MRKLSIILLTCCVVALCASFTENDAAAEARNLRRIYSRPPSEWPKPFVDEGVDWQELGILPPGPLQDQLDSLRHLIALGKILFFDTRLSGSGAISCASCHQPELSWTDHKPRSLGHEGALNKRNSPTLQNVWVYKKLFWDGRSSSLEDQAFGPINSESEMHGDMPGLSRRLRAIPGYPPLFDSAYGDPGIDPDRIAGALAMFQRTITSRPSRFDEFLSGNENALSNAEIRGLHLFRTRARCINCHHGPLFTDNRFHNTGFHLEGNPENDRGLYQVTHRDADLGKFKTPSLRDLLYTGPWMHHGMLTNLSEIISVYNRGDQAPGEPLIRKLSLLEREERDLLAFLSAISAPPLAFSRPSLPH